MGHGLSVDKRFVRLVSEQWTATEVVLTLEPASPPDDELPPCPTCGATGDESCRTKAGTPAKQWHHKRPDGSKRYAEWMCARAKWCKSWRDDEAGEDEWHEVDSAQREVCCAAHVIGRTVVRVPRRPLERVTWGMVLGVGQFLWTWNARATVWVDGHRFAWLAESPEWTIDAGWADTLDKAQEMAAAAAHAHWEKLVDKDRETR